MNSFAQPLMKGQSIPTVEQLTGNHLLITGQTGSGKTTTVLSLLSHLQQTNTTTIVFDPTGEYGKLPNATVYQFGRNTYLDAGQFDSHQLLRLAGVSQTIAPLVDQAMNSLRIMQNVYGQQQLFKKLGYPIKDYQKCVAQLDDWACSYPVRLLAPQLIEEMVVPFADERADYHLLGQQYDYRRIRETWMMITQLREQLISPAFQALFGTLTTTKHPLVELNYVLKMFLNQRSQHTTLVIDLAVLKNFESCQTQVLSIVLKHLLNECLAHPHHSPVKIVIDEAHRYLPDEEDLPSNGIFQVAREGRKCGLTLLMTTQSPLDLPARLRSQFSNQIVHHLAGEDEQAAVGLDQGGTLRQLGVGEAVLKAALQSPVITHICLPKWWQKKQTGYL